MPSVFDQLTNLLLRVSRDLFRGDNINTKNEGEDEHVSISLHDLYKRKGGTERVIAGLCSDAKVSSLLPLTRPVA